MRKLLFCTLSLLLLGSARTFAQDIHFSQFYETPLYRNPALAGIMSGDVRASAVHRNQWNSLSHPYKTTSLNAEYKMPVGGGDDFLTAGVQVFHDQAGSIALTSLQALPVLNYHKSLSSERNAYLSVGFMGGYVQRRFDRSKVTTNSGYDGRDDDEFFNPTQFSYLDASAGVSFNSGFGSSPDNNFIIGAAYHHVNRPRNSFFQNNNIEVTPKIVYSGAVKWGVGDYAHLTLQGDHFRQGAYRETIGGILYGMKIGDDPEQPDYTLSGGAMLRWNDAVIPTVKLDYTPFSVGLSYDVNLSSLKTGTKGRGGFELSLSYIGFLDRENSSLNAVHCPRF